MIPGMVRCATTFVAGVEAGAQGHRASHRMRFTQMEPFVAERTDGRLLQNQGVRPLAGLNDLFFTGWDISKKIPQSQ